MWENKAREVATLPFQFFLLKISGHCVIVNTLKSGNDFQK